MAAGASPRPRLFGRFFYSLVVNSSISIQFRNSWPIFFFAILRNFCRRSIFVSWFLFLFEFGNGSFYFYFFFQSSNPIFTKGSSTQHWQLQIQWQTLKAHIQHFKGGCQHAFTGQAYTYVVPTVLSTGWDYNHFVRQKKTQTSAKKACEILLTRTKDKSRMWMVADEDGAVDEWQAMYVVMKDEMISTDTFVLFYQLTRHDTHLTT